MCVDLWPGFSVQLITSASNHIGGAANMVGAHGQISLSCWQAIAQQPGKLLSCSVYRYAYLHLDPICAAQAGRRIEVEHLEVSFFSFCPKSGMPALCIPHGTVARHQASQNAQV